MRRTVCGRIERHHSETDVFSVRDRVDGIAYSSTKIGVVNVNLLTTVRSKNIFYLHPLWNREILSSDCVQDNATTRLSTA